uniref:Uncharacterized protein n=1 Tax=Apteryx owenii TaxID=8824 RepID=A0A8B9Q6W7_APTOW
MPLRYATMRHSSLLASVPVPAYFTVLTPVVILTENLLCMVLISPCTGVSSIVFAGTPRSSLPLTQIVDQACQEAETYRDAGVDGLIIENMHDLPYTVCPGPEITAAMTVVSAAVKRTCPRLPLGVQILCAANQQAIAVALAAGTPPCCILTPWGGKRGHTGQRYHHTHGLGRSSSAGNVIRKSAGVCFVRVPAERGSERHGLSGQDAAEDLAGDAASPRPGVRAEWGRSCCKSMP